MNNVKRVDSYLYWFKVQITDILTTCQLTLNLLENNVQTDKQINRYAADWQRTEVCTNIIIGNSKMSEITR